MGHKFHGGFTAAEKTELIGAPYALPAPLGMAGRFELLLDGNGRCPGSHHLRGSFQNRSVFRSIEASFRIKPPAHNHPTSEYVTVLSGDFLRRDGDKLDPKCSRQS